MQQVLSERPKNPRALNPSVPQPLETIALKCLQKKPSDRYTSAAAMVNDLERWLSNRPIMAKEASRADRIKLWLRREWRTALSLTCSLVMMGIAFWLGATSLTPRVSEQTGRNPLRPEDQTVGKLIEENNRLSDFLREEHDKRNALETDHLVLQSTLGQLEKEKSALQARANSLEGEKRSFQRKIDSWQQHIDQLDELRGIHSLDLSGTVVTSTLMEFLKGFTELRELKTVDPDASASTLLRPLDDNQLTDAGLVHVRKL